MVWLVLFISLGYRERHERDWRGKFIGIFNSIREYKYLSTPETDQFIPVFPFIPVSQDPHISTFQFEDEGYIPEKFRGHELCNANIQSSIGVIVIHLIKMISIKGKAVRFIVRFQKPVMLSQYIHIMNQCEFVSDILIVLYHKQVYLIPCLLQCMARHQNYYHCSKTKEVIAWIGCHLGHHHGRHLGFQLDVFIVLLY